MPQDGIDEIDPTIDLSRYSAPFLKTYQIYKDYDPLNIEFPFIFQ